MATNKMTQKNAIAFVLEHHGTSLPNEVKAKVEEVLASLSKKNTSSGEKKLTPTQEANVKHKEAILERMRVEPNRVWTITELQKEVAFGEEMSNQRVSALVRQLVNAEEPSVKRTEEKGKAFFSLI